MGGPLSFQQLASRLVRYLNELVRRGEATERGLARLTGYSQPHIHNVLKGARGMNPELADSIMERMAIPLLSLLTQEELSGVAPPGPGDALPVPMLSGRLGGGQPFPRLDEGGPTQPLPRERVAGLANRVLVVLDGEERSMWPAIWPHDVILMDRSPVERRTPSFDRVYAFSWEGGSFIGRCRRVGDMLVVVMDNARETTGGINPIPLSGLNIIDVVAGRVVWLGRDLDLT